MRRAASCAQKNTASRLVDRMRRHSSSARSTARPELTTPALLTRMVTVPKAFSAASNAARHRRAVAHVGFDRDGLAAGLFDPRLRRHRGDRPAAPPARPRRRSPPRHSRNAPRVRSTRRSPARPCREDRRCRLPPWDSPSPLAIAVPARVSRLGGRTIMWLCAGAKRSSGLRHRAITIKTTTSR